MSRQRTIRQTVSVQGLGLFGGQPSTMHFLPAEADSGLAFVRNDQERPVRIAADIEHIRRQPRRTSLMNGTVAVETVEHVLSAIAGLGIDNITVEVSAEETPSPDGSPMAFAEALHQAGIVEQSAERKPYIISSPICVSAGEASISALPGPSDMLDIVYDLDYPQGSGIGRQVFSFRLGRDNYLREVAAARTFLLAEEARQFQSQGLGKHLKPGDVLVIGPDGTDTPMRYPDEPVRHKVADLIGDMALLGRPLAGRIVACKSGHELNHELVRRLKEQIHAQQRQSPGHGEPIMDIRRIMRLLPHRYPFLMIDRIVEVDGDRRAVAIKNVTINEPYFTGHFPGMPIMPGVMILEAMAQLSGILLSQRLEHAGKVAMLLSMDRVKIRRPVRPGDQLVLHAESLHVRTRTGHCRCVAYVAAEVAAEAEIKFMLVDAETA